MSRAFTMADNTVTTNVSSPRGLHVLRRIETRKPEVKPYDEVAADVEAA